MSHSKIIALNEYEIKTLLEALSDYKTACEGFPTRLEDIAKLELYLNSKIGDS